MKKNSMMVRVDPDGWKLLRNNFAGLSDPEISRRIAFPTNDDFLRRSEKIAREKRNRWLQGSAQDLFFLAVVILVLAVSLVLGGTMMTEFNDKIQSSSLFPTESKTMSARGLTTMSTTWDDMILFLTIFGCISVFILAGMIRVHPVFIPIYIIFLLFLLICSGIAANIYSGFESASATSEFASTLTYTPFIFRFFPYLTGLISAILAIIMYQRYKIAT